MYRVSVGASFRLRCCVSGLISMFLLTILASAPAEARWKKRGYFKRAAATSSYEPRYADIVVDANTGDVLHNVSADSDASSRLAHEDHDALSPVRAPREPDGSGSRAG